MANVAHENSSLYIPKGCLVPRWVQAPHTVFIHNLSTISTKTVLQKRREPAVGFEDSGGKPHPRGIRSDRSGRTLERPDVQWSKVK